MAAAQQQTSYRTQRAFWLKHLHQWHWISAAMCLIGMLLFAFTGVTLNHAGAIEAKPEVSERQGQLPDALMAVLSSAPQTGRGPVPSSLSDWLGAEFGLSLNGRDADLSANELYIALPRPGGDAWLSIDRSDGAVTYEVTNRGWISYLNDLHKGRNTGEAWSWFLDVFAGACIVFCATGLFLLQLHAANRPATWPMVGLGLVAPLLFAILFIH